MNAGTTAILAIGSNLGDREAILRRCVAEIDAVRSVSVLRVSKIVETAAVRPEGVDLAAPRYLNAVVKIRLGLDPAALLRRLHEIENRMGRTREVRWGDRTLDVDIIQIDGLTLDTPALTVPHPRAHERAFVLAPWLDIEPTAVLAGSGAVGLLLARIGGLPADYAAEALWPTGR